MAYQWIRFIYDWADSKWIYVKIEDRRGNYWLNYTGWYKADTNLESWDIRDASYTYEDYSKATDFNWKNQQELKDDFFKHFENHLADSLYKAATSFHPDLHVWGSCYEIAWYVSCINSAKRDIDMNSLVELWKLNQKNKNKFD